MPVMIERGSWQIGRAEATIEEAQAVVRELGTRNIFHSQATIRGREEAEEAAKRAKITSGLMWGGVGLAATLMAIYALKS